MKNITELRDSLIDNYDKMKTKAIDPALGKELSSTAGKIINTLKVQLEYNKILKNKNKIKFLEVKE